MGSTTTPSRKKNRINWQWLGMLLLLFITACTHSLAQNGAVSVTQSFSYTGQIVTWAVPSGVTSLTIEARGAEGGDIIGSIAKAGKGAIVVAQVNVTPSQSLSILVGQNLNGRSAGGGGSFVVAPPSNTTGPTPLVIAGGGGGASTVTPDTQTKHGQSGPDGGAGGNSGGAGGTNGSGGKTIAGGVGAGGGGLLGNGEGYSNTPIAYPNAGGRAFVNGGGGGQGQNNGGFGGGGAGALGAGGGGGGYSGGGGGGNDTSVGVGGGGGSIFTGTSLSVVSGASGNSGNGLVIISYNPPIRYVKQNGTGTGTSWTDASGDLQSQIDAAGVQQVWVAGGTYTSSNSNGRFAIKNGVAIYGGFSSSNPESSTAARSSVNPVSGSPSSTTLTTSSSRQIIFNPTTLDNTALLDGFVITGGNGFNGGGGFILGSARLVNCLITGNQASSQGGGLFLSGPVSLLNCVISGNSAGSGGGLATAGSPSLVNCVISNNSSGNGGGIYSPGGPANLTLTNCIIRNNSARSIGGGIYNLQNGVSTLINCLLSGNSATTGGGICNTQNAGAILINCSLAANRATNTNFSGAAIFNNQNSQVSLTNTILWDNQESNDEAIFNQDANSSVTANNCLIGQGEGDATGVNNLTATTSPFSGATDYQLASGSAAIDKGDNASYQAANGPSTDLGGNPRLANGRIDIGAYEFQGPFCQPVAISALSQSATAVCGESPVTFTFSFTAGPDSYTIASYRDSTYLGEVQRGSGGQSYASIPVTQSGSYQIVITSACSSATTTYAPVTVNPVPTASLSNNGPLSCTQTSVTLMASGGSSYTFTSSNGTIGTPGSASTIQVNAPGSYLVSVANASGCTSSANTTVGQDNAVPQVSIAANPSLTISQGQTTTLTAQVSGGSVPFAYSWSTGATSTSVIVSQAGSYSVQVTGANGCSATASATVSVVSFGIAGVSTISCDPITANKFSVSFSPLYQGTNGQPVRFSVINELLPTTQPAPYTLQLYTDNPTITLSATQSGVEARYPYNWLAACQTTQQPNTPPRVLTPIASQTAQQGHYFSYVIPDGTFTDNETPLNLQLSARGVPDGLIFSGVTLSGTPSTTAGSPFSLTIIATDPGGLTVSTPLTLSVLPATTPVNPTAPFAITGVTTISCTPVASKLSLSFAPQYAGLNGQAISFEVVNEFAPTSNPAPYSLTLYRDNPVIQLRATQSGSGEPVTFAYHWLEACQNLSQDNTPPRLNSPVGSQTAIVGQTFSLNLANTFIDQETPNQISLSATGLPAGLSLTGTSISGTPSTSGVSTVTITATDPGNLTASTSFNLTVHPASSVFGISGVQTLSCVTVSGGLRSVTFQPLYSGTNGQPISFSVVNEKLPTTAPGPYQLNLYTDNPVITLKATQTGTPGEATYVYPWLSSCPSGARAGATEPTLGLQVRVLGNPIEGQIAEVEIRGVDGQRVSLELVDLTGRPLHQQRIESATALERVKLAVGSLPAQFILQVSTASERQVIKLLKP